MKYPIDKTFYPLKWIKTPMDPKLLRLGQKYMNIPKSVLHDPDFACERFSIPAINHGEIELLSITPKECTGTLPCLIFIHGGGFIYEGVQSHFALAKLYAKEARCKVIYVRYRLAPDFPFPYPQEDCFTAYEWVLNHAKELDIDPSRIGVTGDSAGGTLSVTTCLMARDRQLPMRPCLQLLIYPFLDARNESESFEKYTDVPMWNSSMSIKVTPLINPYPNFTPLAYRSPLQADSLKDLPPAYIEVAEFDCLHDDGINYAKQLEKEGIPVILHDTKGTVHGYDTMMHSKMVKAFIQNRIAFLNQYLHNEERESH